MGIIFGAIRFRDERASPADLATLEASVRTGARQPGGGWVGEGACLGQLLHTWEAAAQDEQGPTEAAGGRVVLVAAARLDNRAELYDRLRIAPAQRAAMPDRELLLRAYETWGEGCVHHLLGDWSFAAWDRTRRALFVARDHCGNTGLYYRHDAAAFAFSSFLRGLLDFDGGAPALNEEWLASLLVSWPRSAVETPYAGVYRLPPGHTLTAADGRVQVRPYWSLDDVPDVRLGSDEAYVEAFLERYDEAVRCRLQAAPSVCTTLSAGLDSGSVTVLAARELRRQGKRLTAYTAVPRFTPPEPVGPRLMDEWALAGEVAAWAGNVDHLPIRAEDASPVGALRRMHHIFRAPMFAAGNAYWVDALLDTARQSGYDAVLTGQLGNLCVSWAPDANYVFSLLYRGDWARAWAEIVSEASRRGSWLRTIGSLSWRSLLASPPGNRIRAMARRPARLEKSAIHPAFAQRLDLTGQMEEAGFLSHTATWKDPRALQRRYLLPALVAAGAGWHEMGAAYGLAGLDPTIDRRVIEYCMGVPVDQFARNGQTRWLVRRAMEGLLPPGVQWNTRRGLQAADLGHRLVATRDEVEAALQEVETSPAARSYLDIDRMRTVWNRLLHKVNAETTRQSNTILLRGLSVGLFLVAEETGNSYHHAFSDRS